MAGYKIKYFGKLKLALLGAFFLILGIMIWTYVKTGPPEKSEGIESVLFPKATLAIGKIEHTAIRDGKTEWVLEGSSGQYSEENKKVTINDLVVDFFLDDGSIAYLKGEQGILNRQTNDMQVSGNAVLENKGYRLKTEKMNYIHEKRIILSNTPVMIENEIMQFKADRLKLDLDKNITYLTGNVKGHLGKN